MILVTGASGGLGRLIVEGLSGRDDVVRGSRTPGADSRLVDFDTPSGLADAFTGIDVLLLISAGYGEDDTVIARHEAAISAAEKAGVRHIVYTSLTASGDHMANALAHRWTERRLREGSADWTILRNGLYAELLAAITLPGPDGRITTPLGDGRLAAVARQDLADVAVRVTTDIAASTPNHAPPHVGQIYELVGEEAIGGADVAAALSVTYEPATLAQTREALTALGAAGFQVPMITTICAAIAAGFMSSTTGDLATLLGRTPRRALDVIKAG